MAAAKWRSSAQINDPALIMSYLASLPPQRKTRSNSLPNNVSVLARNVNNRYASPPPSPKSWLQVAMLLVIIFFIAVAQHSPSLDRLYEAADTAGGGLISGLGMALGNTISAIGSAGDTITSAIGKGLYDVLAGTADLNTSLVNSIGNASSHIIDSTTTGFAKVIKSFSSNSLLWILVLLLYLMVISKVIPIDHFFKFPAFRPKPPPPPTEHIYETIPDYPPNPPSPHDNLCVTNSPPLPLRNTRVTFVPTKVEKSPVPDTSSLPKKAHGRKSRDHGWTRQHMARRRRS